jgi:hypothetical protein
VGEKTKAELEAEVERLTKEVKFHSDMNMKHTQSITTYMEKVRYLRDHISDLSAAIQVMDKLTDK